MGYLVGDDEPVGARVSEIDQVAGDVLAVGGDERALAAQHDAHPLVRIDQSVQAGGDGSEDVLQDQSALAVSCANRVEVGDRLLRPRRDDHVVVIARQASPATCSDLSAPPSR